MYDVSQPSAIEISGFSRFFGFAKFSGFWIVMNPNVKLFLILKQLCNATHEANLYVSWQESFSCLHQLGCYVKREREQETPEDMQEVELTAIRTFQGEVTADMTEPLSLQS